MKQPNPPIMTGEKTCIRCGCTKPVLEFHKHTQMADGRLNKCRTCVKECVDEWRLKNPGCRAVEHANGRERKGILPWSDYLEYRKKVNIGRKVASLKYAHKRRDAVMRQPRWDEELDEFALEEAASLAQMRGELLGGKWEVDHIVPLMHKAASGLHNAYNLQVVPKLFNIKKSNRSMAAFIGY